MVGLGYVEFMGYDKGFGFYFKFSGKLLRVRRMEGRGVSEDAEILVKRFLRL